MTSGYIFFWYVLPFLLAGAGWAIALYSRYIEKKTRPTRRPGE